MDSLQQTLNIRDLRTVYQQSRTFSLGWVNINQLLSWMITQVICWIRSLTNRSRLQTSLRHQSNTRFFLSQLTFTWICDKKFLQRFTCFCHKLFFMDVFEVRMSEYFVIIIAKALIEKILPNRFYGTDSSKAVVRFDNSGSFYQGMLPLFHFLPSFMK